MQARLTGENGSGAHSKIAQFMRRSIHFSQMDLECTVFQMYNLLKNPAKVYNLAKSRKSIKNHYSRDDPCFLVLTILFLTVSSIAYCLQFHVFNPITILRFVTWTIFVEFLLMGSLIATATRFFINTFFMERRTMLHVIRQKVEWAYCFDIFLNAFFPFFLLVHVLQFFLMPFLLLDRFISVLASSTLFAIAMSYSVFITFMGVNILPFTRNTHFFLYPIGLVLLIYIFFGLLLQTNPSLIFVNMYFSE